MTPNFISEITYGTLSGGSKNGRVMFEITCNGQEPENATDGVLAEVVDLCRSYPGANCRSVHFRGPFPIENTNAVYSLLAGFKSIGFSTYITLDGKYYYSWLAERLVDAIIVHLASPKFLGMAFNELIYDIADPAVGEPKMPDTYDGRQLLYLNPTGDLAKSPTKVFNFIHQAKLRWNINAKIRPIKEKLYPREETE
jgi:hypothetical protein